MPKLVAIGDSITQGFASGAITHCDRSYPAMIAECMGLTPSQFRLPDFTGEGGLPTNIEWIARQLEHKYGSHIGNFRWLSAVLDVHGMLDKVEDYWERGPGSTPGLDILYHNLAVFGFQVGDATVNAGQFREQFLKSKDNFFLPVPSNARERAACRVLNPSQRPELDSRTQIEVAKQISRESQIEHLIVALGANNCLGSVVHLRVDETGDVPPGAFSSHTLWSESAFRTEYRILENEVRQIDAKHVYLANIPHVTILPIAHGVMNNKGMLPLDEKYFDYYKYFWISDADFDPDRDRCLSKQDAIHIDNRIDSFNRIIAETAANNSWELIDFCSMLDDLAIRRNHGKPTFPMPAPIADLGVNFFLVDAGYTVLAGTGLFSLDGVHPTNCGYAIMAQQCIDVIRKFDDEIRDIDFDLIRRYDPLVTNPPYTLSDIEGMLAILDRYFHLSRWILGGKPPAGEKLGKKPVEVFR